MKALGQGGNETEELPEYLRAVQQAVPVHFDPALRTAGELVGRRTMVALSDEGPPIPMRSSESTSGRTQDRRSQHAA